MWLLLVNGTKVTTKVLPRVSFQVAAPGVSSNPYQGLSLQPAPLPSRLGGGCCRSGAGSHRRTCAVSHGWTIRLQGPTVQSPAGVVAGGMSWWKLDAVLHREQNSSQLAECPGHGRQLERTGSTWMPASTEWILLQCLYHRKAESVSIKNWNGWPQRLQNLCSCRHSPGQGLSNWSQPVSQWCFQQEVRLNTP